MKKVLILLFLLLTFDLTAQIKKPKNLTREEQYCKVNQEQGGFFGVKACVLDEIQKPIKSTEAKGVCIFFPKDFYIEKTNGNKYAKGYVENNSTENIKISRLDSTIDFVQEYFLINGIWISGQKNEKSSCGNSYFEMVLNTMSKIEFQLSISDLIYGNIKIPFKINVTIGGKVFESNVIEVNLFKNQINNLIK